MGEARTGTLMPLDAVQSDFDIISRLRGFLTLDGFGLFCNLRQLSYMPGKPVLEIGVFCGRSLAGLACAFEQVEVVGVDPFYEDFNNSPALEGEAEYLALAAKNMSAEERISVFWKIVDSITRKKANNLRTRIRLLRTTQDEFFRQRLGEERYQLVHVDGEHTYEAVNSCLDMLDNLLVPGAWLVIDDLLNWGFPDISRAVHTHRGFRRAFWPVFYGFNKGVFMVKPDCRARVSTAKERIYAAYSSRPEHYVVRRTCDMAVVAYRRPKPRATVEKRARRSFVSAMLRVVQRLART